MCVICVLDQVSLFYFVCLGILVFTSSFLLQFGSFLAQFRSCPASVLVLCCSGCFWGFLFSSLCLFSLTLRRPPQCFFSQPFPHPCLHLVITHVPPLSMYPCCIYSGSGFTIHHFCIVGHLPQSWSFHRFFFFLLSSASLLPRQHFCLLVK